MAITLAHFATVFVVIIASQLTNCQAPLNTFLASLPTLPPFSALTLPPLPVLFPQTPCFGPTMLRQGLCQRDGQCTASGGVEDGQCAAGFGVCCVSALKCGATGALNNTYFSNADYSNGTSTPGSCGVTINKVHPLIVQLRIDLIDFDLAGPDAEGRCAGDSMVVSGANPDFRLLPLCGKAVNQHLIVPVDASPSNQITINFELSSRTPARWLLRVIQIMPESALRAPRDCLQYFTGTQGNFSALGVSGGPEPIAIAGLRYAVCFRKEQGYCSLTLSPSSASAPRSRRWANAYQYPLTHGYVPSGYVRPINSYVSTVQRPILRPAAVYRYPLVAARPVYSPVYEQKPAEYLPNYQSPFQSSWYGDLANGSYVPPMPPARVNGPSDSSVVLPATTEASADNATATDGAEVDNSSDIAMNSTVDANNSTDAGNNSTTGYVAPIDDPAPTTCANLDALGILGTGVVCGPSATPLTITGAPFVVFVDNRGKSRSRGFSFDYDEVAC